MGLASGAVSTLTLFVNLYVTDGDNEKYFTAALTSAIALIVLAYLLIFPTFLALRIRRPHLERPFHAPGGMVAAVVITALTLGWSLVAATCMLWPGFGTADPDAALPAAFRGDRLQFELLVLAPIVAVVVACTAFQITSRRHDPVARHTDPDWPGDLVMK